MRPIAPHSVTRGPVAALRGVARAGDVAGDVLAAVGAPDDPALVRARHASCQAARVQHVGYSATTRASSRARGDPHVGYVNHRRRIGPRPRFHRARRVDRTPRRRVNTAPSARGHIAAMVAPRDARRRAPDAPPRPPVTRRPRAPR